MVAHARWRYIREFMATRAQRHASLSGCCSNQFPDGYGKSFCEMPRKKLRFRPVTVSLQYWIHGNDLHNMWQREHQKYGPVYKECQGLVTLVHVGSAHNIEEVFRQMDKWPLKPDYVTHLWKIYRRQAGESKGLLTSNDDEWYKYRRSIASKILTYETLMNYDDDVNEVVVDFTERLRGLRDPSSMTVPNIIKEFHRWSFETISLIIFERRFGALEDPLHKPTKEFIDAVGEMFATKLATYTCLGPDVHFQFNTKYWKRHCVAWDTIFRTARLYIDEKVNTINQNNTTGTTSGQGIGQFLTRLVHDRELSSREIYANVAELMLGAVDTTTNTMCFTLDYLARHPRVQEKLQHEVDTVLKGRMATGKDGLPYLNMVLKESMRLSPVVPLYVRSLSRPALIGGYQVPAHTPIILNTWAASRDPGVFHSADEFIPERWDRESNHKLPHPFASLPFGFGPRVCVDCTTVPRFTNWTLRSPAFLWCIKAKKKHFDSIFR